jgi:hypothetical protein
MSERRSKSPSPKGSSAEKAEKDHKKHVALSAVMHRMFTNAKHPRDAEQAKAAVKLGMVLGKFLPKSKESSKKVINTQYVLKPLQKEVGYKWAAEFTPSKPRSSVYTPHVGAAFLPSADGVIAYDPWRWKMVVLNAVGTPKETVFDFPVTTSVDFCELSPDGTLVATVEGYFHFNVYDARSGETLFHERASIFEFTALGFSPDGRHIVLTRQNKGVYVWSIASRSWVRENVKDPEWTMDRVSLIRFSPDGTRVAFLSLGTFIEVLTFPALECIHDFDCWAIHDMCFSSDSQRLVSIEEREEAVEPEDEPSGAGAKSCTYVYAWSAKLGRPTPASRLGTSHRALPEAKAALLMRVAIGRGHLGPFYTGDIVVRLSPDASKVAVQSLPGEIEPPMQMAAPSFTVFNVKTGKAYPRIFRPAPFKGNPAPLADAKPITTGLAFSADGKKILQTVRYTANTLPLRRTETSVFVATCFAVPR